MSSISDKLHDDLVNLPLMLVARNMNHAPTRFKWRRSFYFWWGGAVKQRNIPSRPVEVENVSVVHSLTNRSSCC